MNKQLIVPTPKTPRDSTKVKEVDSNETTPSETITPSKMAKKPVEMLFAQVVQEVKEEYVNEECEKTASALSKADASMCPSSNSKEKLFQTEIKSSIQMHCVKEITAVREQRKSA